MRDQLIDLDQLISDFQLSNCGRMELVASLNKIRAPLIDGFEFNAILSRALLSKYEALMGFLSDDTSIDVSVADWKGKLYPGLNVPYLLIFTGILSSLRDDPFGS